MLPRPVVGQARPRLVASRCAGWGAGTPSVGAARLHAASLAVVLRVSCYARSASSRSARARRLVRVGTNAVPLRCWLRSDGAFTTLFGPPAWTVLDADARSAPQERSRGALGPMPRDRWRPSRVTSNDRAKRGEQLVGVVWVAKERGPIEMDGGRSAARALKDASGEAALFCGRTGGGRKGMRSRPTRTTHHEARARANLTTARANRLLLESCASRAANETK